MHLPVFFLGLINGSTFISHWRNSTATIWWGLEAVVGLDQIFTTQKTLLTREYAVFQTWLIWRPNTDMPTITHAYLCKQTISSVRYKTRFHYLWTLTNITAGSRSDWVYLIDTGRKSSDGKTVREVLLDIFKAFPKYDLNSDEGIEKAIEEIATKLGTWRASKRVVDFEKERSFCLVYICGMRIEQPRSRFEFSSNTPISLPASSSSPLQPFWDLPCCLTHNPETHP